MLLEDVLKLSDSEIKVQDKTKQDAEKNAPMSMGMGCTECIACVSCGYCAKCVECINCTSCITCFYCTSCYMCDGCHNCQHCRGCADCTNCSYCRDCSNCTGKSYMVGNRQFDEATCLAACRLLDGGA